LLNAKQNFKMRRYRQIVRARRLRLQTAHRRRALIANSFPAITAPIGLLTPCVAEKRHADEF
jgi:hypothetical protein